MRAGRVRTIPAKLQDFKMHYQAASIDRVVSSIQANLDQLLRNGRSTTELGQTVE